MRHRKMHKADVSVELLMILPEHEKTAIKNADYLVFSIYFARVRHRKNWISREFTFLGRGAKLTTPAGDCGLPARQIRRNTNIWRQKRICQNPPYM